MALDFPDPGVENPWTDGNGTEWTHDGNGWTRAPLIVGVNDPNVFADYASFSVSVGEWDLTADAGKNTVFGVDAFTLSSSGYSNSIFGYRAGKVLDSGIDNTLIGRGAGESLAGSSDGNVVIGAGACPQVALADTAVIIGAGAKPLSTGESNAVVIGAGTVGKGTNTVAIGSPSNTDVHLNGIIHASGFAAGQWVKIGPDGTSLISSAIAVSAAAESIYFTVAGRNFAVTPNPNKFVYRLPYNFTVTSIKASCANNQLVVPTVIDVNINGTSMMTTNKLVIDVGTRTTVGAAVAPVLTTTVLLEDDELIVDLDSSDGTEGIEQMTVQLIGFQTP